jgi:hypothetical protein
MQSLAMEDSSMDRFWDCKIVFIASSKDYVDIEEIVNAHLDDGWQPFAVTRAPDDSGDRVWFLRRR